MRVLIGLLCAAALAAEGPGFEVASIKPHRSVSGVSRWGRDDSGRFTAENMTLQGLIIHAWGIQESQLTGGPHWLDSNSWDIVAKPETPIPDNPGGYDLMRAMLRNLLTDRFALRVHTESREITVYTLVQSPSGIKLKKAPSGAVPGPSAWSETSFEAKAGDTGTLARALSNLLGRPVIDQTKLDGAYDIKLKFAPETRGVEARQSSSDRPTIFAALQEQLGLKLASKKEPVDMIVVDSVSLPSEN